MILATVSETSTLFRVPVVEHPEQLCNRNAVCRALTTGHRCSGNGRSRPTTRSNCFANSTRDANVELAGPGVHRPGQTIRRSESLVPNPSKQRAAPPKSDRELPCPPGPVSWCGDRHGSESVELASHPPNVSGHSMIASLQVRTDL